MRPYILLLLVGILVAALAAVAVRGTGTPSGQQAAVEPVKTKKILVARANIAAGSFVRADEHIGWEEWPQEKVQSPPYLTEENASVEAFNGAVARRTVFAGEPITQGTLVKSGEGGFMSAVLQPGKRAVSLAVNATTGNAGFIFPGDFVDLILTHAVKSEAGESFVSETFVENVRVLAVDQMLDNPENKALLAKTVTLEVEPQQAEAINVAVEMGKISLSLRSLATDGEEIAAKETVDKVKTPEEKALERLYHMEPSPTRHFTRDSDISAALGNGAVDNAAARVRLIRGNETVEMEFK